MAHISIIIINYNTPEVTRQAIMSVVRHASDADTEMILIENGSEKKVALDDDFRGRIAHVIGNGTNLGFAAAVNQGLRAATGDIFLLLNSDALLGAGSLEKMVGFLESHPEVGIVGPKTISPDGSFQISAGAFPSLPRECSVFSGLYKQDIGSPFLMEREAESSSDPFLSPDWVSGGCMMIRKEVALRIGFFDERFFFGVEDVDFCFRAKEAGFQVAYLPSAVISHRHGYSSGGARSRFKLEHEASGKEYFFRKHFPNRVLARLLIVWMYQARIGVLQALGKLK
jgi:GT2 family glycosyltransferase